MAQIRLSGVSLSFPVLHGNARSLKKTLFSRARSTLRGGDAKGTRTVGGEMGHGTHAASFEVQALRDLSFGIAGGERVGLIGHNGAGKTTLLRVLAGIYETTIGEISVEGAVHALIDAGAGMHPDLTGRENLRLFACRHQLDTRAHAALEADVEAFAELGAFFDLPVRIYSSGMAIRLGFALATVPRPEILLMDEWFMAGDSNFQAKARARLEDMVASADVLVFTSHSLGILREWCTRVLWLESGRIVMDGTPEAVLASYEAALAT